MTREAPGLIIVLVDQSQNMSGHWWLEDGRTDDAIGACATVNVLLKSLILQASVGDKVRDRFFAACISHGDGAARFALQGSLKGDGLVSASRLAANPLSITVTKSNVGVGLGGAISDNARRPIWLETRSSGKSNLSAAVALARDIAESWVRDHPDSFPPIVLNVSGANGEVPIEDVKKLKAIKTNWGEVLLANYVLSANTVLLPSDKAAIKSTFHRDLFDLSSVLPVSSNSVGTEESAAILESVCAKFGMDASNGRRFFVASSDLRHPSWMISTHWNTGD